MRRITSALFLDFDNLFSRLLVADRAAADSFINQPELLIERLVALDETSGARREVLVRRAYLNPAGSIPEPGADPTADRLPISQYRGPLTKAGYEVIDCPTLATGKKNAADIRMVIDVLDALAGPVRYDEVIIGSSDADFTPLLVKLRANDRRTMILTTGSIAAPYGASADRTIGESELVRMLSPALTLVEPAMTPPLAGQPSSAATSATKATKTATTRGTAKTASAATATKATTTKATKAVATRATKAVTTTKATMLAPVTERPTPSPAELQSATDRAIAAVAKVLAASETPVALSAVGLAVHKKVGAEVVRQTKWFGHSTLTGFLQERHKHLSVDTLRVWDPARHAEPPAAVSG